MALLTNTDSYRILKHLALPYEKLTYIKERIALVATEEGEDFESQILSLLAQLDSLELKISEEKLNVNSALIRADVLEWEGGGKRSRGMIDEYGKLRGSLANFLGITLTINSRNCGGAMTMEVIL